MVDHVVVLARMENIFDQDYETFGVPGDASRSVEDYEDQSPAGAHSRCAFTTPGIFGGSRDGRLEFLLRDTRRCIRALPTVCFEFVTNFGEGGGGTQR